MILRIVEFLVKVFCRVIFRIEISSMENIPENGACMVCANHQSNWDPVILILFLKRKVHFMAKSELFENFFLNKLLTSEGVIPIKRGAADIQAIKSSMEVLKNGEVLGMFPTGTRTKQMDGADAKKGAALIASRTGANVVPIYINASYKVFSKIKINIGKCMDLTELKGKKLTAEELEVLSGDIYGEIKKLAGDTKNV